MCFETNTQHKQRDDQEGAKANSGRGKGPEMLKTTLTFGLLAPGVLDRCGSRQALQWNLLAALHSSIDRGRGRLGSWRGRR